MWLLWRRGRNLGTHVLFLWIGATILGDSSYTVGRIKGIQRYGNARITGAPIGKGRKEWIVLEEQWRSGWNFKKATNHDLENVVSHDEYWGPPSNGWLKINTDTALFVS
ncbi:hypothetical protein ACH5RR_015100 [Cinchona calisaya]|uniref:Uncharacterized protein n=1 Tax=Cinchona calisaya TaxID=153742 RepID=A0ABD2ZTX0_9GENT